MSKPGEFTITEIFSQPDAWRSALETLRSNRARLEQALQTNYAEVIFTGCGSTYYAALAAAAAYATLTGRPARGVPGSELWLNPELYYTQPGRYLLAPISRSGETSETLQACRAFRATGRGEILTLSCYPDSQLASIGDWNLVLESGQEESYAQTRAFTTLYLAAIYFACLVAGREDFLTRLNELPALCARLLERHAGSIRAVGRDLSIDRVYFLGSGPRYGLACELSMKMKEMSLTHCEPFHFLEFRHGPKTMASQGSLVFGLLSETNAENERAVAAEVEGLGAQVILVGEDSCTINFASSLPEILRGPLYLVAGQLFSYERAIAKGLNPDRPFNLQPVIKLT